MSKDKKTLGDAFPSGSADAFVGGDQLCFKQNALKAELAREISSIVNKKDLTQLEIAGILGTTQANVSRILRGRLTNISVERLLRFLAMLGADIEIRISLKRKTARGRTGLEQGGIRVSAD